MKKTDIKERVAAFMHEHDMYGQKSNIIIGLSGGADSVCLLFVLKELQKEAPGSTSLYLHAVHVNHMIRGTEAERDETFVRALCKDLGVDLTVEKRDVPGTAGKTGESIETAGRRLRYEIFNEKIKDLGGGMIATAHHKNDSAETVIFNMARGTGLGGIAGIAPKRGNLIRPLMCLTRVEIEGFIKENNLDHVTDSTNSDTGYTRNFIRHKVIAPIEENINKNFTEHICRLSETARKYKSYVDMKAEDFIKDAVRDETGKAMAFLQKDLAGLPDILLETVIMKVYEKISGDAVDISSERIIAASRAIKSSHGRGRLIELPRGVSVSISSGKVGFFVKDETGLQTDEPEVLYFADEDLRSELAAGGRAEFHYGRYEINMELTDNFIKNANSDYTKFFNYDKITSNVCFRRRLPGDVIVIDSSGSEKKLKKEFIDRKIPERLRDKCLIMADGHRCLWAVGVRQSSESFADKDSTVLKITVKETETDIL